MSVQQLDLTTIEGFRAAVAWVRSAIILQPRQPGFHEIEATTKPASSCNVFVKRSDAYLVGFRRRDKLHDIGRELKIASGKQLTEFAGKCGEQVATEFAGSGVIARNLALSRH